MLLLQVMAEPETEVSPRLSNLQAAELLYEQPAAPEPTYAFKHVLTQEVAYHSLSHARQQALHERTAQAIEGLVGERLAEHYGELAHHYSRSDNTEKAVAYLQRAGQQAADRSAYREAITHLTRGLELLPNLPDTPERTRHELDLQITLGHALIATKGQAAPDVEQAFTRARVLCEQVGETPQLFAVLGGLRVVYVARGPLPTGPGAGGADALPGPARARPRAPDAGLTMCWGVPCFSSESSLRREPTSNRGWPWMISTQDRLRCPSVEPGHIGVRCRRYGAWTLWYLGYPDQALQRSREAIALAQERAHPYSLA